MPYTPTTPTLLLCDELVAVVAAAWDPVAPSGVERAYFKRLGDADDPAQRLAGRRVYLFPTAYSTAGETRAEDLYTHEITALVVERYPDAGDPPTEWVDERVDFVFDRIVQGLDWSRDGPPTWNPKLVTLSAAVTVVDLEKLVGGGKLFYSSVDLVFSEIRDA